MTQSTIHQTHLESAKEQLQGLLSEIQQLNNQVASKRETALKIQGVIEYLDQIGVKLPEPETTAAPEETEEVETSDTQVVTE